MAQFDGMTGSGTLADRPAAYARGRMYWVTDAGVQRWTRDNGTVWEELPQSASALALGSTSATVVVGNDTRLADARNPLAHASTHSAGQGDPISHQNLSGAGTNTHATIDTHLASTANPHSTTAAQVGAAPTSRSVATTNGLTGGGDLSADRTLQPTYGSSANTVCQGNDARLSDSRTPTTHGDSLHDSTVASLSSGVVPTAELGAGTANSTTFLRGDQTWASPTATVAAPFIGDQAPGTFTVATGKFGLQGMRLTLTGAQRGTIQGTGRLIVMG